MNLLTLLSLVAALVAATADTARLPEAQRSAVVAGVVVVAFLLVGGAAVRASLARRFLRALAWRNFDVPRLSPWTKPITPARAMTNRFATALTAPLLVGALAGSVGGPRASAVIGAAASVVGMAALDVLIVSDWLRARRNCEPDVVRACLASTLTELQPATVLYFGGPETAGAAQYIVDPWIPTLERLPQPVLAVVRDRRHLDAVASTTLPIVFIARAGDVEQLLPPTIKLALFASHDPKNNHVIRLPGITDVFIGHGDSDKARSATRLVTVFDEIWVSGPAARDRFHSAGVAVRDEQIREVGRPQISEVRLARAVGARPGLTVLYAPTCAGPDTHYSSVLTMGASILTTLSGLDGVRVLFRPHPGRGSEDARFRREVDALQRLAGRHSSTSALPCNGNLYAAFNEADVLITDISAVITDFAASAKPYVVTNPAGLDHQALRVRYPSAVGAYVLDPDCRDLPAILGQATGDDPAGARRAEAQHHLLGDTSNPFRRFAAAVQTFTEPAPRREPDLTSADL